MAKEFDQILTMCDGYKPIRDANKLLKKHGLFVRMKPAGGDQKWLSIEKIKIKIPEKIKIKVPKNIANLIKWRESAMDKYGDDLIFGVQGSLARWDFKTPNEHREALRAFQALSEDQQLDIVKIALGED